MVSPSWEPDRGFAKITISRPSTSKSVLRVGSTSTGKGSELGLVVEMRLGDGLVSSLIILVYIKINFEVIYKCHVVTTSFLMWYKLFFI